MNFKKWCQQNKKIILIILVTIFLSIGIILVIHTVYKKNKSNINPPISQIENSSNNYLITKNIEFSNLSNSEKENNIRYMNNMTLFFIGNSFITVPFLMQDVNEKDFPIKYLGGDTMTVLDKQKYDKYCVQYDEYNGNKRLIKIERIKESIRQNEFIKIKYKEDKKEEIDKINILNNNSQVTATYIVFYNDQKQIISIENANPNNNNSEKINMNYDQNKLLKMVTKTGINRNVELEHKCSMTYNENNKLIKIEHFVKNQLSFEFKLDYNEDKLIKLTVLNTKKPINDFEINISSN